MTFLTQASQSLREVMKDLSIELNQQDTGVSKLVQAVKDIFQPSKCTQDCVYKAVRHGDLQRVLHIINALPVDALPERMEYQDSKGRTPLLLASRNGDLNMVQWLLQFGANLHVQDRKGNTVLHYACSELMAPMAEFLVQLHGLSPYVQNQEGFAPLDLVRRHVVEQHWIPAVKCVQILETRCKVFEGWVYESVDNVASSITGFESLQSWIRRYAVVLRVGSSSFLEIALHSAHANQQRSPLPSSTIMYRVDENVIFESQSKVFNNKDHTFKIVGAKKLEAGFMDMLNSFEFAAINEDNYVQWTNFLQRGMLNVKDALLEPLPAQPNNTDATIVDYSNIANIPMATIVTTADDNDSNMTKQDYAHNSQYPEKELHSSLQTYQQEPTQYTASAPLEHATVYPLQQYTASAPPA